MKRVLFGVCVLLVLSVLPARAQSPVGDALQTLAAATLNAQQTVDTQNAAAAAQRGTTTAIAIQQMQANAQATRDARATQQAVSATQQAMNLEATRSTYATRQVADTIATQQARDAQATAVRQQQISSATQSAVQAESTRQAVAVSATSAALKAEATTTAIAIQAQQTRTAGTATAVRADQQAQAAATATTIAIEATHTALVQQQQAEERDQLINSLGFAALVLAVVIVVMTLAVLISRALWLRYGKRVPVVVVSDDQHTPPDMPAPETLPQTRVIMDENIAREIESILKASENDDLSDSSKP